MQGNDLSNESQPCLVVVFEGLLGIPPEEDRKRAWWQRTRSAKKIVADFRINELLVAQIRHTPYPVEVATFLGEDFAREIEARLDEVHALVRRVWHTTPEELARVHITHPDVARIYDPDPRRAFASYGSLGRHLMPEHAARLGDL